MRICFYCQHVLGMGHLFRTLAVCRALAPRPVSLVLGGPDAPAALPDNVSVLKLPALSMDAGFSGLLTEGGADIEEVKAARSRMLAEHFEKTRPDLLAVELFPFGRKAFSFELLPLLSRLRRGLPGPCRIVCSLRDILVEKKDAEGFEKKALARLNEFFDALVVHADPSVVKLSATFSREAEIRVPVFYSGYVGPKIPAGEPERLRRELGVGEDEVLVTAAAGGGSVGGPLLSAAVRAFAEFSDKRPARLLCFTGPYLAEAEFEGLRREAGPGAEIRRFSDNFPALLAASDLCVTMAGYNTMADLAAARARALVWPFAQNREQGMRAGLFSRRMPLRALADSELSPGRLAAAMEAQLALPRPERPALDLSGAEKTAAFLETLFP